MTICPYNTVKKFADHSSAIWIGLQFSKIEIKVSDSHNTRLGSTSKAKVFAERTFEKG